MDRTPEEIRKYCRLMGYSREYGEFAATHRFCEVCGQPASLPHHIRTRGAHGNIDEPWNLIALCRFHHQLADSVGNKTLADLHPQLEAVRGTIESALERGIHEIE